MPILALIVKYFTRPALLLVLSVYSQQGTSEETFTYAVPAHWQQAPEDFRARMEATTKNGMMSLEGQGVGYQIEGFDAYAVRDACVVFIYKLRLPNGNIPVNELDTALEHAKSKFETGKRNGIVQDIISIQSQRVGDFTGNVFEWIGRTKKPLKQAIDTSWYHPAIVTRLLNVSAQCTEKGYAEGKNEIFDMVHSSSVQP